MVESVFLEELEEDPTSPEWPTGPALLAPFVWLAWDDLPSDFWESVPTTPSVPSE